MEAVEAVNEGAKLVARALEIIKILNGNGEIIGDDVELAESLLEEALVKLTNTI